ncbi:hypothetical protein JOS77_06660 [Chromobacterium haemolyticum]|nr:hypothetical protein JOS77_06660 [Chromobacterium haemolyticum]
MTDGLQTLTRAGQRLAGVLAFFGEFAEGVNAALRGLELLELVAASFTARASPWLPAIACLSGRVSLSTAASSTSIFSLLLIVGGS